MVIYQGYCRHLKQKVDFTVDTVECLETKKGQKWVVKGVHEGHKITTFTNKATGESLMEQLGITREAEEVVVFDAEEAVIEAPNHEDVAEEIEVFDAEEVVLEAPKIEHEGLTSKHYRKDGTLDMRYKICREIARGMKAESFESDIHDAEESEDDDDEMSSVEIKTQRDLQELAKEMDAEGSELKKDSCCCGADKEKPCACMFTGADCSAKEPMCQCYKDLAEAKSAKESFDAESYNRVYKAEPNAIIFEEHIPPEVWNNMGPDAQGHYLSTRDESVLIAPCCGVTKAELRMDENANAECNSCCYSGDDFHRRWWANKPAPKVRAKLEAETVEQESLNPNTVVVPRFVYYKMMMHLPPNVSITQTDDGLSMIIGFHNQDAQKIDALVEAYTPVQDGSDVEDTLVVKDDLSIVPSVYYPEESMGFDAEVFNVELQEWGEQEMKTHGKNISFKDWLDEESETHGDMPLVEWAKDEEESHDERYGAESFESPRRTWNKKCDMCGSKPIYDQRYNDEWEGDLAVCEECFNDVYGAESFDAETRKTGEICGDRGCKGNLLETEYGGSLSKLHCDKCNYSEFIEWDAESFEAPESQSPNVNKTLVGLLGLGALGAFLAPEQIRALFKKLK